MRARLVLWSLVAAAGWGAGACSSQKCSGSCVGPTGTPGSEQPGTPGNPDNPGTPGTPAVDGSVNSGTPDLGMAGGGSDGGGACCDLASPAGPWPLTDVTYGAAQGLAGDILDSSSDDAQNIWAATQDALYVLQPGQTTFKKFTAADGLHIGPFTDANNNPNTTFITALAGGHGNEVFVGYYGYESAGDPFLDTTAQKHLGQADKVTLDANGQPTILRYLFPCDYDSGNGCWEDRSPRRMIYAHQGVAAGHLFIGFNHGVAHVFNDSIGDHVHPEVWYNYPDGSKVEKIGEFYGLALTPQGDLWTAGRYGVGLQSWNPVPHFMWVDGPFKWAFTIYGPSHGLDTPPGYEESDSGAAVLPDGTLYVSSFKNGLSAWQPATHNYNAIAQVTAVGIPSQIVDIAADPDGTLWIVSLGGQLLRYDPATAAVQTWPGVTAAHRVVIDTTVTPRALYVSMDGGLAVIRAK